MGQWHVRVLEHMNMVRGGSLRMEGKWCPIQELAGGMKLLQAMNTTLKNYNPTGEKQYWHGVEEIIGKMLKDDYRPLGKVQYATKVGNTLTALEDWGLPKPLAEHIQMKHLGCGLGVDARNKFALVYLSLLSVLDRPLRAKARAPKSTARPASQRKWPFDPEGKPAIKPAKKQGKQKPLHDRCLIL